MVSARTEVSSRDTNWHSPMTVGGMVPTRWLQDCRKPHLRYSCFMPAPYIQFTALYHASHTRLARTRAASIRAVPAGPVTPRVRASVGRFGAACGSCDRSEGRRRRHAAAPRERGHHDPPAARRRILPVGAVEHTPLIRHQAVRAAPADDLGAACPVRPHL